MVLHRKNKGGCCDVAEMRESNKAIGKLHVDIDCSDALKGLKAVTREAKRATSALQELEEQQKKVGLSPSFVKKE